MRALWRSGSAGICLATSSMALHPQSCNTLWRTFNCRPPKRHRQLPYALAYNAPATPDCRGPRAKASWSVRPNPVLRFPSSWRDGSRTHQVRCGEIGIARRGIDQAAELGREESLLESRPIEQDAIA